MREDSVVRPDGNPGIYGVIESSPATGIVALTDSAEIVLVGQYRYPTSQYSWEIVEGGANSGESVLDAAKRELQEEAGLVAQSWEQLGHEVHLSNCISAERGTLYLARGLTEVPAAPDATEILEVKKVPMPLALRMVFDGEIQDAMSIIGILRADVYLRGISAK